MLATCDHSIFAFPRHDDPDGDISSGTCHVTTADDPLAHPTVGKDRPVLRDCGGCRHERGRRCNACDRPFSLGIESDSYGYGRPATHEPRGGPSVSAVA